MNAYEALAFSYDALTYDVPYEKIAAYFETLLRRSGVEAQTVLDLACGTGSLSVLLAARGFRVLGVDCSEEMLTVASEKAAELALAHAAPEEVICAGDAAVFHFAENAASASPGAGRCGDLLA